MSKRGHNDVLKGNEKEFFRRMGAFLDHLDRRRGGQEDVSRTSTAAAAADDPAAAPVAPAPMRIWSPRVDGETRAPAPVAGAADTSRRI